MGHRHFVSAHAGFTGHWSALRLSNTELADQRTQLRRPLLNLRSLVMFMEETILKRLGRPDYTPAKGGELLQRLRLPPHRQRELQEALERLERSGRVAKTKGDRYIKSREADLVPGRIQINRAGKGFLRPDDADLQEIVIPESDTGTALHGDHVLVRRDRSDEHT